MANTYTQIYIQVVFAVSGRQNLLSREHKEELHKYITGIVTRQGHKLIAINSMPDHVHILLCFKPDAALSELVRDIKANSSSSSTNGDGRVGSSAGRKASGHFHTGIRNSNPLSTTFRIKSSIIGADRSRMNT